ncbi:Rieske [2Fe-2S] iron-sulfur domain protein [Moelleriella libera RCEF 2490]|uniref:Rieske [2Fe-2S] iron-sulfur domain protein n=1 Tax=Moelleriella libera RCEF 2490 TaxID=1081109 RepID=A0A168CFN0_9HYPO|nr:Rieske [2Fe-2S] iron-sulfur domain protein [Moelleriella libera RCEF 2490]
MNFFSASRPGASWISAGTVSGFADLSDDNRRLADPRLCGAHLRPGCKVFRVPKDDPAEAEEVVISSDDEDSPISAADLSSHVLVFQHRGKFHAVDHSCPHSAYPLSNGTPFDIEDFGVVLSAGLTCPKHGWSFDLFTGMSDTGRYQLPLWEVQLRDEDGVKVVDPSKNDTDRAQLTVWVRRKHRTG